MFLWNLLSKPTHYIRVRIAEGITARDLEATSSPTRSSRSGARERKSANNPLAALEDQDGQPESEEPLNHEQQALLVQVAQALARLGRVKRVGLGVQEKKQFVSVWGKTKRR